MHGPGNSDADQVQGNHGRVKDAHIQDVGGGSDDGRDNENDQNGVAEILPHEPGRDDAHESQKKDKNRHFENQAHAQDNAQKKRRIFSDRDHRLELSSEGNKETEGLRIDKLVTEVHGGGERADGG